MADLGSKLEPMVVGDRDAVFYPSLHLNDKQSRALGFTGEVGDTKRLKAKVRVASISRSSDGDNSMVLEFLDAEWVEEQDAGARMFPSMTIPPDRSTR